MWCNFNIYSQDCSLVENYFCFQEFKAYPIKKEAIIINTLQQILIKQQHANS